MSNQIEHLPPPWPNQALAQARTAHQIPLNVVTSNENSGASSNNGGNSNAQGNGANKVSEGVDIQV